MTRRRSLNIMSTTPHLPSKLKTLGKLLKWLAVVVMLAIMLLTLGILIAPRFDWRVEPVLSSSMEPSIRVGGAVLVKPAEPDKIKESDVVVFESPVEPGTELCHRVVEIDEETLTLQTKGDANTEPDPFTVNLNEVSGQVVLHAPYLGYVADFARTTAGLLVLLHLPGTIIIACETRNIWKMLSEMEKAKKQAQTIIPGGQTS